MQSFVLLLVPPILSHDHLTPSAKIVDESDGYLEQFYYLTVKFFVDGELASASRMIVRIAKVRRERHLFCAQILLKGVLSHLSDSSSCLPDISEPNLKKVSLQKQGRDNCRLVAVGSGLACCHA